MYCVSGQAILATRIRAMGESRDSTVRLSHVCQASVSFVNVCGHSRVITQCDRFVIELTATRRPMHSFLHSFNAMLFDSVFPRTLRHVPLSHHQICDTVKTSTPSCHPVRTCAPVAVRSSRVCASARSRVSSQSTDLLILHITPLTSVIPSSCRAFHSDLRSNIHLPDQAGDNTIFLHLLNVDEAPLHLLRHCFRMSQILSPWTASPCLSPRSDQNKILQTYSKDLFLSSWPPCR